jgi:cholesterol 7-dehydrogenase
MLINSANKKKVLGDLPPVFPNGWFALLDSISLPTEGVRHVQALGEKLSAGAAMLLNRLQAPNP